MSEAVQQRRGQVGTATSVANRLSDLVGAINAKTATTGVAAAINSANGYQLTSADGRAITVTSTNAAIQTAVSGFAVKSGTSVASGAIELTAAQYKTNILTPAAAPTSSTVAYAYTGGGMTINGSTIAAAANDSTSYVGGVKTADTGKTSAKAMAAAINLVGATNVTASASTSVQSHAITLAGDISAGDLYINGQDIGALAGTSTVAERVTQLVTAINTKTGATGVTASATNDESYTLTAADGRNIDLTSNNGGSRLNELGFAASGATNGVGGTAKTYYGKLALTSAASFTIAGDVTGSGLAAATYADKRTEGSTAATGFNPGLVGKLDNLTLTAVSAEDAATLKDEANVRQLKISDNGTNILSNAAGLRTNNKISAGNIALTGTNPVISMTFAEYGNADVQGAIAKIASEARYQITLSGLTAAQAVDSGEAFKSDAHVATVSVSDSEANIKANWNNLASLGDTLSTIKISGSSTPNLSITDAQYSSSTALLSKINGLRLQVTGVSAANASTVAADTSVVGLTVSDTGDHIEAKFSQLNGLAGAASNSGVAANAQTYAAGEYRINVAGKLTAITRTDTATIDISAGTYANGSTALEVLLADKTINVKDLTVDEAVDITTDDPTSGSEVAWNATATLPDTNDVYDQKVLVSVKAAAADIEADLAAGTSKLQAIDVVKHQLGSVQASSGKVNISGADFLAETYSSLLPNMIDGITVSDVTLAGLAPVVGPDPLSSPYVSSFTFKDTGTNLVLALDKLAPGTNHTLSSKVTGIVASDGSTTPVPINLTQVNDYRATLAMVKDEAGANASLNVSI